ncbi:uncharacterized protein LOC117100209 [Anneissia japonica]|uniref:uncharacterized protein LOC117100209 n=1 Tax=Anneissia japonica TaxID=1529436 RepID=UPI00142596C7|nr:uncharacterized protein LOC117100209 [Anneissia japonica]
MTELIALDIGMALLKGITGKIGTKMFDSVFPDSKVPSYFDKVYKQIAEIVKKEIKPDTINEINGQIKGIRSYVCNVYAPRKESGASKQELFDMIKDNAYDIAVHMVAVLQEDAYAEPGLGVFVIGAGMHLTLLQELALVDPNVSDPTESSYAVSVQKYAKEYVAFVDRTYDSIVKKRTNDATITEVKIKSKTILPPPEYHSTPGIEYCSKWTDQFLGKTYKDSTILEHTRTSWSSGTNVEMENRSKKKRSDYIQQVKKDLVKSLHDPIGVANLWRKLEKQPIPPQSP